VTFDQACFNKQDVFMLSSLQSEWNHFWENNKDGQFTRTSWSKRRIIAVLNRYVRKGVTVLDAGCGSGFFSAYFISRACNTFCLDYSPIALEITREKTKGGAQEYILGDLLDEDLPGTNKGHFDIIFTDGLFEHFSGNEQAILIDNFKTMKKLEGKIITFVPNRFTCWTIIRPFYLPAIQEKPFTMKWLKQLYLKNGLAVDESGGINVIPCRYSPDFLVGKHIGMLLYCVGH